MSAINPGDRVTHANDLRSYGRGEVRSIAPSPVRPPSKAFVRFDREPCDRLVWLDDLRLDGTPRRPVHNDSAPAPQVA